VRRWGVKDYFFKVTCNEKQCASVQRVEGGGRGVVCRMLIVVPSCPSPSLCSSSLLPCVMLCCATS
jgi:hypothetical protein